MDTAIDNAIKAMAEKVTKDTEAGDALKFSQSALNLAHVKATLDAVRSK